MFGKTCPCGSGRPYDACCGPLHRGVRQAGSAVELMRSRYAAYALNETDYVFRTWHPRTRPGLDELAGVSTGSTSEDGLRWAGLEIHGYGEDWVEFTARWRGPDGDGSMHQRSRFEQRAGRWVYVDGEVDDDLDTD